MARLVWLAAVLLVACSAYAACALRFDRVAAVTCCERVEQAWTVLRSWSNACADERARAEATAERFAAMLLAVRSRTGSSATPLSVSLVCDAAGLSGPAVHAYLERALCAGLPLTHMDLVRSVYSPLMEEAPHNEDALTSDIAAACRARQLAWLANVTVWRAALQSRGEVAGAQERLCGHPCTWIADAIAGAAYDL